MDKTKEFILQCTKAKEIQKGHFFENGDYWSDSIFDDKPVRVIFYPYKGHEANKRWVWLPRQDQLQAMLNFSLNAYVSEIERFWNPEGVCPDEDMGCKECKDKGLFVRKTYNSMEQLWLAFVMLEKYNKTWNGKEWEIKNV